MTGVRSPGLLSAYEALSTFADVTVVAPADQRSGHSHMLTLNTPLRAKALKDLPGFKVDFTPVDCVKLDDALVHGAVSDPRDQIFLASLVQMIDGLGMGLVAEGVETMEQLRQVAGLGCRRAQGYLLAKPMPQADVAAVLAAEAWRCELDLLGS